MKTRSSPLLLLLVFAAAFTEGSEEKVIYKRIGDEVTLQPPTPFTPPITQVEWRKDGNIAVEWDEKEIDTYPNFKDRSDLNTATGALTLRNLTEKLSGVYEVWINGNRISESVILKVIYPVPKPHITVSCNEEKTQCTLTCEGNVTAMDPKPTYIWKFNATEQKGLNIITITPETSAHDFICCLENKVSRESSEPIPDPFTQVSNAESSNPKINMGFIVFACLLAIVVCVPLVHRIKSGMWFYQKDSMPWEADFWQRTESSGASELQPGNEETERNSMMESNS